MRLFYSGGAVVTGKTLKPCVGPSESIRLIPTDSTTYFGTVQFYFVSILIFYYVQCN